jgi:hypothetical protein
MWIWTKTSAVVEIIQLLTLILGDYNISGTQFDTYLEYKH